MKNRLFLLIIFGALLLVHIIFNIETIIPGMFSRFIKGVVSFGFFYLLLRYIDDRKTAKNN